ncbi:hypothetical protein LINPERHAP1_LOCUS97 [Linum perenne]
MYCLAGWEGSAHDGRLLRDALSRPNGFRVPKGKHENLKSLSNAFSVP